MGISEFPQSAYFDAPICRNCGADLHTPYCTQCGQKKTKRLNLGAYFSATMDAYSDFEFDMLEAIYRLVTKPGKVAREYVMGARTRYMNPLKLLLIAIIVLLIVLNFVRPPNESAVSNRALEIVQEYSQLSFSLGVLAIFIASLVAFSWRQPYNILEHFTLALYTHVVVLLANAVNQLSYMVTDYFQWFTDHRGYANYYMDWLEVGIMLIAFQQFFTIPLNRSWPRLLVAAGVFVLAKKALVFAYAWTLVKLVLAYIA